MFSKLSPIIKKFKENKWLLAFTIACAVVIALTVTTIVLGVKLGKSNEIPEYTEGGEVGVYYYDVADGEVLLTLSGGNKFTIAGPGLNKTGSYVATNDGFTLDFIRDEDGEATATVNGDSVSVVFKDGAKMTFLKKVNYTVSFNVDGGTAIDNVIVVNGKTAAKPADPIKDDYVFLGWYADTALTTPFAFDSTVIKDNTIVYAKWAQKGEVEYTISFDLGYDGATLESIPTIGGKAYGVTAPERTGYTFGGWWISMYEDGAKLSYAYTEDTVFTADTTLFAVWQDDASDKLASPKASVTGNSIKWDAVNGAVSYTVVITDAAGAEVKNESNIGTTTYSFDFSTYPAGEYIVSVTAVGSDSSKNSVAAVRSYANKTLDRVTDFTVINGIVIYNAVEGAEKYYVTVDCGNPAHKHDMFDNGTSTTFSILNCTMQKGGIKITVTASAKGYADSVSKTYVYEQNLDAITNVTYDAAKDAFVWTPVNNAVSYYVELTYGDNTYKANIGNKTSFSLANYSGEISIKVTPVSDGYNSPDAATAAFTKTAPAAPTGLTVSGNIISWNEVEGATSYIVKVGNASFTTETNSFDITTGELALVPGDYYSITVQTITATGSSAFCPAINAGYLVMDTVVNYAQNTLSWTPVIGAVNYLVRINGGNTISVNGCSTTIKLTKSGVNTIEVRYTDLGGSKWVSTQVYAYAVTYMSRSLSGELTEYVAIGDNLSLPTTFVNNGFDFDGWYNTPGGADGNGKQFTDATFNATSDITLYANWTPKTYQVELQTGGYDITNITENTKVDATYTKDFILPVPVTSNTELGTFLGWYTAANGDGDQLTDEDGNSVITYPFARNTVAYPFFDNGVLSYVLKADGTYAVRKGQYINKVKSVTIPEEYNGAKVTTILENGFAGCTKLTSIEIPNSIQLVGVGAFSDCTRLESINVYTVEGNHEILYSSDDGALVRHDLGTNYLEVVPRAKTGTYVMNEEIQVIRNKAFERSKLTSIVISKSVVTVASRAFYMCSELESIDFIEGRTNSVTFEDDSFYRCNNVKYFKIPAALENVNINMLQSLTSLASIAVEANHTAYGAVGGLLTNNRQDTIIFVPAAFISGDFTIPAGIQYVGERAFENCSGITSVTVPNYVKEIGARAFNKCTGIKTVTINGNRKQNDLTIGEYAFASCSKLTSVTIGGSLDGTSLDGGVITIGDFAFIPAGSLDAKLTSFTVGDGANIAKIGNGALQNQAQLNTISFGTAKIDEIGDYAFAGCTNLSSVIIPATTTAVGAHAFDGCKGVASVTIAEGSENLSFGEYAFAGCIRLTTVNLPASVSNFDGAVFSGCNALREIVVDPDNTALKSVNGVLYDFNLTVLKFYPIGLVEEKGGVIAAEDLPDTLTTIDKAVFNGNTALKSIVIEAGVTVIADEAFKNCTNLATITFVKSEDANATLSIGNDAFYKCPFTEIEVPAYTAYIGDNAFYGTKFKTFVMPANLTYIGAFAFSGNTKLSAVNIPANVSFVADGAFSGCTALKTLTIEGGDTPLTIGTDTHTTAANGAFYNTRLSAVTLPDRVVEIGAYAFTNNSTSSSTSTNTIRSFTAGSGLQKIGFGAFYRQRNLDTVTLNEGLVSIGKYAFSDAGYVSGSTKRGIQSITIPSTVTSIGTYAFGSYYGSTAYNALSSVTFAPGGTAPLTIGADAFKYSSITNIEIPKRALAYKEGLENTLYTVAADGGLNYKTFYQIFNECSKLENITVEEGSTQFTSINGIIYTLDSHGIATELLYCPRANKGVDGVVTIPNTVILVENGSFYNTTGIHAVKFEEATADGAELYLGYYVGSGAASRNEALGVFSGSKNTITKLELPKQLVYVGAYGIALRGTSAAQDVEVIFNQNSTIKLSENAIQSLDTKALALPKVSALLGRDYFDGVTANTITFAPGTSFTSMPSYGINACNNLKTFEIPASVVEMGTAAFYDCTGITSITFAANSALTKIGGSAFRGLTSLESITLPEKVVEVGTSLFSGCVNLKTVVLPAGITGISASTFNIGASGNTPITPVIESVTFAGTSTIYKISDGAIYSADGERLIYYPAGRQTDSFTVADGVKYIEDSAFAFFPGSEIKLPEGLENIGHEAFSYANITEISIPKSILNIGTEAFKDCRNLVTFKMDPNSAITKMAAEHPSGYVLNGVFENCVALKNVTLSDNIENFGPHAFAKCTSLENIILPAALKTIQNHTFSGCTNLAAIVIPNGVEFIGNQAFANCTGIVNVVIPAEVKTIDSNAFTGAANLETVTFENGSMLETLGGAYGAVFNNCAKLTVIDLSVAADLKNIGLIFTGCTALETVKFDGTQVTELPANLFANLTNLKTVTLPEKLEVIGNNAFAGATALESVTIPATVNNIGTSAFEDCTGLKTVTFAEGSALTQLGTASAAADNIFKNTTSLEKVVLPSSLEMIGGHVFENSGVQAIYQNNGIDEVSLPSALTTIGEYAFSNCDRLTDVVIFGNVNYVGGYAFNDCDELQNLTLSEGVSFIGSLAFAYCEKLSAVALPQSITTLEGNPFAGCIGLTSFTLHEDNTAYRFIDGILYDWTAYTLVFNPVSNMATSLSLPETVYEIAAGAFVGSHIQNLVLPGKITTIPDYAFANCEELVSVKISNSITSIGNYAFNGCTKLDNVIIPKSVNTIGDYAFANCTSLNAFVFEDKDETDTAYTLGTHLFEGCSALTTAVVPNKLSTKYLPSYMFANTGIVNAVVPENITDLDDSKSEGVFAYNTKLESITFKGVDFTNSYGASIGNRYFYNATALKYISGKTELPMNTIGQVNKYAFAGCTALEVIRVGGAVTIYDYAFADCTGLKHIYFNLSENQDALCGFDEIRPYAFAGCTGVETLIVPGGPTSGQFCVFYNNVFDGWTANQTIIFLNDFRRTDAGKEHLPDWSWWYAYYNEKMLDGCNAQIIYREELFDNETVTIDICYGFGDIYYYGDPVGFVGLSEYTKVKTLNIGMLAPNYCSWNNATLHANAFKGFTAEQTINFTYYTYAELIELIKTGVISGSAFNNCAAKICDKDGNVLIIEGGAVTSVTNADGTQVLWTPATT